MKTTTFPANAPAKVGVRRFLVGCGVLSSVWYVGLNILTPILYDGYSAMTLTVSELSAIGAPTRPIWVPLAAIYLVLFAAFGVGVLQSAGNNRRLRILGWIILAYALVNVYWPPMHQRGMEPTLTDALHITWAAVTVFLMILMMGFGAAAFGKGFKIFTIVSLGLLMLFGALTAQESPNIPTNGPTPYIGLFERINIGVFLVWIVVLASTLLLHGKSYTTRSVEQ